MDLQEFVFAELSEPKLKFSDYDVTIAGRRGAGKSTLAVEFFRGDCCIMDVEGGNKQVRGVYKKEPKTWKELKAIQKEWRKAIKAGYRPPFSVLLFDTQTKLSLMCDEYVLSSNGWEDFTQGEDGKNRWNARKSEYDSVMNGFKELGFQIVYICHGKDKEIKLRGQESYKQFVPDVSASFDYAVLGAVDFVFYLEKTRVKDTKGEFKEVRRLILQNDLDYDVKCRFPELPDEIIYEEAKDGVKEFFKAWDEAVNGEVHEEEPTEETPVFATMETTTTNDEDDDFEVVTTLEELQIEAVEIREKLLETMDRNEVVKVLKEHLGVANIGKCDNIEGLTSFIKAYK